MTGEINLFGWEHLLLLLCTAAAAILLFRHRDRLRRWRRRESLRYVLAGILFVNMTMFYGVFVIKGVYDWHIHLPLHFCFISGFLFMAVLASGSRKWFGAVFLHLGGPAARHDLAQHAHPLRPVFDLPFFHQPSPAAAGGAVLPDRAEIPGGKNGICGGPFSGATRSSPPSSCSISCSAPTIS